MDVPTAGAPAADGLNAGGRTNEQAVSHAGVPDTLKEIPAGRAEAFGNLCALSASYYLETPDGTLNHWGDCIIFPIYRCLSFARGIGLDFPALSDLEMLGLIKMNPLGYKRGFDREKHPFIHVVYGESILSVTNYASNAFPSGNVILTDAGKRFANDFPPRCFAGYMDILQKYFIGKELTVSDEPLLRAINSGSSRYEKINRDMGYY